MYGDVCSERWMRQERVGREGMWKRFNAGTLAGFGGWMDGGVIRSEVLDGSSRWAGMIGRGADEGRSVGEEVVKATE